jgi:hypothetical protein
VRLSSLEGKTEEVALPELGGEALVRGLTRAELRDIRERTRVEAEPDEELLDLLFVCYGVIDPPLTGTVEEQISKARVLPGGTVARIARRVMWLTGLRGMIADPYTGAEVPRGPFRSGTDDDDRRRDVPGTSDSTGLGGNDRNPDEGSDASL